MLLKGLRLQNLLLNPIVIYILPNGLYERFEETVFNTVFEMERVKKALLDVGWKNVYFARIQDLKTPSSHLIHSNPKHTELKSDQKQISPSVSFS